MADSPTQLASKFDDFDRRSVIRKLEDIEENTIERMLLANSELRNDVRAIEVRLRDVEDKLEAILTNLNKAVEMVQAFTDGGLPGIMKAMRG